LKQSPGPEVSVSGEHREGLDLEGALATLKRLESEFGLVKSEIAQESLIH
jgi:hypothetical protein